MQRLTSKSAITVPAHVREHAPRQVNVTDCRKLYFVQASNGMTCPTIFKKIDLPFSKYNVVAHVVRRTTVRGSMTAAETR